MFANSDWKTEKLFFFDKGKEIRWQKRQKKYLDSKESQHVAFTKNRKGRRSPKDLNDDSENSGGFLDLEELAAITKRNETRLEIDPEDEEDTQRFLLEEAKFSAPGLLAQIEKYLILLAKYRSTQKKELQELNEEIETVYGAGWHQSSVHFRNTIIEIDDDLHQKLCYDFEQFSAGAVYVMRKWQTDVYRELAALKEITNKNYCDFMSTPDVPPVRTASKENQRTSLEEKNTEKGKKSPEKMLNNLVASDSKISLESETHSVVGIQKEVSKVPKPKTRADKFKLVPDKGSLKTSFDKVAQGNDTFLNHVNVATNQKGSTVEHKRNLSAAERDRASKLSHAPRLIVAPYGHENIESSFEKSLGVSGGNQGFLPGFVINFSMTSKLCHDNGWITKNFATEDFKKKNVLEYILKCLRQTLKEKQEEAAKAALLREDGPLKKRYYGDSKRDTTIKYKKGVAAAKFLSKKANTAQKPKRFLITMPDGSMCCYYPSGRIAVITSKCTVPGSGGYYTIAYSDDVDAKMLACFTPTGRGCCNYTEKTIRFLNTTKEASFNDENGIPVQKWKWAYGKLSPPEQFKLSNSMSFRCVSQNTIALLVHIDGEVAKFSVAPNLEASEPDFDNLGTLITNETFASRTAVFCREPPKKLVVKESDRRAARQKKDLSKTNSQMVLNEESQAERLKDLDEKFPERKEMDLDAPYLLELHKLQRKVKNIVFDWMEHYRRAVGISRPEEVSMLAKRRQRLNSANSLPGAMPSFEKKPSVVTMRAPSAPPIPASLRSKLALTRTRHVENNILMEYALEDKRPSSASAIMQEDAVDYEETQIEVPQLLETIENGLKQLGIQSPRLRTPRPLLLPKEGCPIALRLEMLGDKNPQCRCDKRRMPFIADLEYDAFIGDSVPKTQLIVVSIVSSRFPRNLCDEMLDELYYDKNKAQNLPCVQSRYDPYRLLRYDLATASETHEAPLLLRRHNVAPGMFLMYVSGRLLFADYIFNGYGNAKRDFLKQVMKTRKDSMRGVDLAQDFRFTTRPSSRGPRTAWGGEVPVSIQFISNTPKWNLDEMNRIDELPALSPTPSESELSFGSKYRRRNSSNTALKSYGLLSSMQCL